MNLFSARARLVVGIAVFSVVSGIFFATPEKSYACNGSGVIKATKTTYALGDDLDTTVFFTSDGSCAGNQIKINLHYAIDGQDYDVYATDCPSANQNDTYCAVNGNTYQLHVAQRPYFSVAGSGTFGADVYANGSLIQKIAPLSITVTGTHGNAPTQPDAQPKPIETKLAVAIGNLTTTANLAIYISTLYTYGLQMVGMLAVFMIILGGIKYLTAGGDMGRTKKAIENITNATIGLVLALATYVILNTINPALLQFKPPAVDVVQRQTITTENWCEDILSHDASVAGVEPTNGTCNTKGTLVAKPGTTLVKKECVFKTCPAGLACSKDRTGAYSCGKCEDFTKERLVDQFGAGGLAGPSDADCLARGPYRNDSGSYAACVFTNEAGYGDKGCRMLTVNCSTIHTCEDYTLHTALNDGKGGTFGAAYERNCPGDTTVAGVCFAGAVTSIKPAGHLAQVCNADPCGIGKKTGKACVAKNNTDVSQFSKTIGSASPFYDAALEYCCPAGEDCTPPKPTPPAQMQKECVGNKC